MSRNLIFCVLIIGIAMWVSVFCVSPIEPLIAEQLSLSHTQTSLLISMPILLLVITAIPAGLVADRVGIRKTMGIGLVVMAAGSVLRSTATDFTSLLAYTIIFGFGLGWTFPNLPKLVSNFPQRDKANIAMGVTVAGFPTGTGLALAATVPLALHLDGNYQDVFLVWSIPAIVAASSWWFLVKETPLHPKVNGLPVGLSASLRRAFTNNHLWLLSSIMFIHQFASASWFGWAPVLMMLKGASPDSAGLISSVTLWVMIPTLLLAPRLSHKIGLRKPFLWVPSIILTIAFLTFRFVPTNLSWLTMILIGIANATRFTTLMSLPIELVHGTEVGMASGMLASIGFTGGVIGPLIGGRVLDITGSLDLSLIILTIISVAAAIIASRIPETGPRAILRKIS